MIFNLDRQHNGIYNYQGNVFLGIMPIKYFQDWINKVGKPILNVGCAVQRAGMLDYIAK